ncbi:outer membrane beta-barrel protein [Vibrio sp. LaRot3]|uniref:outer membrane beta-barrel protein n=1 Tax=Vibrio sp. LaRot3 TaxID=2998829 RepID=UPI0022CDFA15|nr:outer membrane beta-barrel protein [Vibrio sp. LaRot3]MDA0147391.1 outer membrane beta-barrel protein [Vibrio sp. LaRot3]
MRINPLKALPVFGCCMFGLASLPAVAMVDPPKYFYADLAAGALDDDIGTNSNVTALSVGGVMPISFGLLASLDYSARFIHPDETTTEIYTLLPGAGLQFNLAQNLAMQALVKAGMQWAEQTNDLTNTTLSSSDEFTWGGELGLIYQLNERWSAIADVEWNRSDIIDVDAYSLRANYRVSPRISFGGFYTHRNSGDSTTNEGGVSLRVHF